MSGLRPLPYARDRIIDAAADLFASKGFNSVNTRAIAKAARVSESTVFRHFSSKTEIAVAVATDKIVHSPTHDLMPAALQGLGLADAARLYANWELHRLTELFVRLYLVLSIECPECMRDEYRSTHLAVIARIDQAQASGEVIDGSPELIFAALHDALVGRSTMRYVAAHIIEPYSQRERDASTLIDIWIRGVSRAAVK